MRLAATTALSKASASTISKSCADSCGYIIAAKKLPDDTFLIPVVIRSHCYGGEWVSNAHAVEEDTPDHAVGFKAAGRRRL